jgi:two-component system sensor histidine kinase CiaH
MSISLIFSIGFYQVSSNEIDRSIRRQPGPISQVFRNRNSELIQDFLQEQNDAIVIAKTRLKANLILINLFILVGGGMLSYFLARRTLKPIEDIHEAQSRFTADASHELRTPIAAMRLENELALSDPTLTIKKAKEQLVSNIEELDKLTALSEGLLQLASLDNEPIQKSKTTVAQLINSSVERIKSDADKNNQTIKLQNILKDNINVNETVLTEGIVTLLDNAIKYSPKNSTITIKTKRNKSNIDITIQDKGIGISDADKSLIFDRFYRADNSRQKNDVSGYGIGLSIAKSAIEAHGGSISVKSTLGKGSTFIYSFPVK